MKKPITVSLSEETVAEIDQLAIKWRGGRSRAIEQIYLEWLEYQEIEALIKTTLGKEHLIQIDEITKAA